MTSQLTTKIVIMFLGVALLVWAGCGGDETSIVKEDTPTDVPITATPTGTLKGQVEGVKGVPISVQILQNGTVLASAQANANGNYQLDKVKPGTYAVQITAKGYKEANLTVQVIANQVTALDKVALEALENPVAHIRGFLTDQATKKALANVRVQLTDNEGNLLEVVTAGTGGFEFENLPADQPFTLTVEHKGYEKQEIEVEPIQPGETAKVEVKLVPIDLKVLPLGDGLSVGTEAPKFSLPDGDGKIHSLADFAGKKVVLIFYRGSW